MKHERELLKMPAPPCPDISPSNKRQDRFTAELVTVGGVEHLGVTVYTREGVEKCRWWQSATQYGYQVFFKQAYDYRHEHVPGKMYSYSADREYMYWHSRELISTPEDVNTLLTFCRAGKEKSPTRALSKIQSAIREDKLNKRKEAAREKIRQRFAGIEEPGEDFKQYVIDGPLRLKRYLFYTYTGKKEQSATCSHCGKTGLYTGIRERRRGICRFCGSSAEYRSAKRLERHPFSEGTNVAILEQHGKDMLIRSFKVNLYFGSIANKEKKKAEFYQHENFRLFVNNEYKGDGKYEAYLNGYGKYDVIVDGFHREYRTVTSEQYIYPGNLRELRISGGVRAPLEKLAERGLWCNPMSLCNFKDEKRPELEYLIKGRFYALAEDDLRGHNRFLLKHKGKVSSASELLGLPAHELDKVRTVNLNGQALQVVRELYNFDIVCKSEDMQDIQCLGIQPRESNLLKDTIEHSSVRKVLNWLLRQENRDGILSTYNDYLLMGATLGLDLDDPQMRFPKSIREAHDQAVKQSRAVQDQVLNAKIAKVAKSLRPLCWSFDGLCIRPATSKTELIIEGETLSHCVGKMNYDKKMADRKTAIFFIRKLTEEEKPFVTLELNLSNGEVIQCYGKGDTRPGQKVRNFYHRWENELTKPLFNKEAKTA